jgi:hypothetical protein
VKKRGISNGTLRIVLAVLGLYLTACGGGSKAPADPGANTPQIPQSPPPPAVTGTGSLTVIVSDSDGRPIANARVMVYNVGQTEVLGSGLSGVNGAVSLSSLPARVNVSASHAFGYHSQDDVVVSQQGATTLAVRIAAQFPQPTVALLPIEIPASSLSADRSALTLRVTIVASAAGAFVPAGYGDYSPISTPSLGLELGDGANEMRRQCFVWLDQRRTVPDCGLPWGTSPYTVSVDEFRYEPAGSSAPPTASPLPRRALLLLDQSRRVAALDAGAFRSYAARRFIESVVNLPGLELALAGFAGNAGDPATPALLPARPLWSPLGMASPFTRDESLLKTGVAMLEPLVGGSAPVFGAVDAALDVIEATGNSGTRTLVMMLGDGSELRSPARDLSLSSLRQRVEMTGVHSILIDAVPYLPREDHRDIADLAAAIGATKIVLGVSQDSQGFFSQTWPSGTPAALDLAADLLDGKALPTLTATFRINANAGAFPSGALLRGILSVETAICPMGCWELPVSFAVRIP